MSPLNPPPIYLIVAQQALVAQDIAEAIAQEVAGAKVVIAASIATAIAALSEVAQVAVAFIEADALRLQETPVPEAWLQAGMRLVLIGDAHMLPCETLSVPFSNDDLERVIRVTQPAH